mmetsp:Transcript_73563/g.137457  ORF Transcript_73563/g.137457 Transcript_73563/m.137457 type:complete len:256 (+) Transcript_73563:71-838(+)
MENASAAVNTVDQSTMTDVESQVVVATVQKDLEPASIALGEVQQSSTLRELMNKHVVPPAKAFVAQRHPWREFCFRLGFRKPAEHETRLAQATSNLEHYKANYAIVGGSILVLGVGLPGWIVLLLVGFAWHTYLSQKLGDPSWKPTVLGVEVTADSRWRILCGSTACLMFLMTWYILLPVMLCFFWHAAMHKGPRALADMDVAPQTAGGRHQRALVDGTVDVETPQLPAEAVSTSDPISGSGGSQAKQPFLETMS